MTLVLMLMVVLVFLLVTKYLEERLGEEEKFDKILKVEEPKRGRFTVAGRRANAWKSGLQ